MKKESTKRFISAAAAALLALGTLTACTTHKDNCKKDMDCKKKSKTSKTMS